MMKAALFVFVLGSAAVYGQNAGMMAAQQAFQASQQAQQAAQQAIDQATITSQQATINMQQAMSNASSSGCPEPIIGFASQPTFSVKQGKVAAGTQVRIKSATHFAAIYYSTDGWAPSVNSIRYTGPITINAETHLQAIAIAPNRLRSPIGHADYIINKAGTVAPIQPAPLITDGVLRAGTKLRLITSTEVNSMSAQVGDKIPLLLDQDIKAGDALLAARGTPADGVIIFADPNSYVGLGDIVFEVRSLNLQGKAILLSGGETLEGLSKMDTKEAVIEPGMVVIAVVTAETPLIPSAPAAVNKP
jgi:hypothetical protein